MQEVVNRLTRWARAQCEVWASGWDRFWFTPADPTTLAAIRICTGLVLLYVHLTAVAEVLEFVGPGAWVDDRAIDQIRELGQGAPNLLDRIGEGWWGWSVWCHVRGPASIGALHGVFLIALLCFTFGVCSRTTSVIAWAGHLSYIHRGFLTWFGMDSILAFLALYLVFGPTGDALSLDRLWVRRRRGAAQRPGPSWSANLVIRLIQVHMCVVYLCAGLAKLQGPRWWDGTAVWLIMLQPETAPFDLGWLANAGDTICLLFSNVGVLLTLGLEIGFAFLVWNRSLRPVVLILAVLLHVGIGLCLGLDAFGAAMLTGCLAFVSPEAVRTAIGKTGSWLGGPILASGHALRARKAA